MLTFEHMLVSLLASDDHEGFFCPVEVQSEKTKQKPLKA